ncbi:MAG: regulatory protein RecX [Actinomycetaceae bacterium]|nr:regulatory protein RecX [Actinomycetaceae bacterium]MDY5853901.1 regulatory protein RecX [Arcanobacterium sp.]
MVDYAEEADFVGRKKPRRYVSFEQAQRRREARNAARTEEDWQRYARETVYRLLGVRDRSVGELRSALKKRDVPEAIAEQVIAAFVDSGLVDDAKFAQSFVRARFSGKTISRRSLAAELRKRGISSDDIDAALEQIDSDDEEEAATAFALRKVSSMQALPIQVAHRRLYGALARRGFSTATIVRACERALEELSGHSESD